MKNNSGLICLKNTKTYPFNNSVTTVALKEALLDSDYRVYAEIISSNGEVGDIVVCGKARNGFKIAYTGSATEAEIYWRAEV